MIDEKAYQPHDLLPRRRPKMWLSDLEDLVLDDVHNHLRFFNVGEHCNISGSIVFKMLMTAVKCAETMDIARK
jgi:5-methyltetrahydrofolate--homocysteine methyltransferase